MNLAAAGSLMSMTTAAIFAALALGISRAPGWRAYRSVAGIAGTAAVYALCDLALSVPIPDGVAVWASRITLFAAGWHGFAWLRYMSALEGRDLFRWERWLGWAIVGGGVLVLMGPVAIADAVRHHHVEWLGVTYADPISTPIGDFVFGMACVGLMLPLRRFVGRWRRGLPDAGTHAAALAVLLLCGFNDALVASGVTLGPYLLDFGFFAIAAAVGLTLVRNFFASALRIEQLSARLEQAVEERTRELSQATHALSRAEKLAAIGQLSAGVAHEINNPTAVVQGNLSYLEETLAETGQLPKDARESLADSLAALQRITRIVRQLLDAGRVAGGRDARLKPFCLAEAVAAAVKTSAPAVGPGVDVQVRVEPTLYANGQAQLFEQVLVNLLVNGAQAAADAGRPGRIEVSAERRGDLVALTVSDNGRGINPEAQKRLFEPFFTTKQVGRGTGLGLAVSLGLMRAQGGNLALVRSSEEGSALVIELPWAEQTGTGSFAQPVPSQPGDALRLLLVDDEPAVLEALRRQLKVTYFVETADGVDAALARIRRGPDDFDAIVCDVVMPAGGGERFLAELTTLVPSLAARTVFLTAGAVGDDARRLVEAHRDRVLEKPLEPKALHQLVQRLGRRAARGPQPPPPAAA